MKKLIILLMAIGLMSCENRHPQPQYKKQIHVESFKTSNDDGTDLFYWYLITSNDGCYYTSSATPISNFSSVNWTASSSIPKEIDGKTPLEEQEIDVEDLEQDLQVDIDANPAAFNETETESTDNASESSSSESSSDGGGDGGGGGGE